MTPNPQRDRLEKLKEEINTIVLDAILMRGMDTHQVVNILVPHIFTSAIETAIASLPEEKDINADSGAYGWNQYRAEALKNLEGLLSTKE